MDDRILLSENSDFWGIIKPFETEGFSGIRIIDHIENGYAQKVFLDHNVFYRDDSRVNDNSGLTPDEIRHAYCSAFEMDPNAQWNID